MALTTKIVDRTGRGVFGPDLCAHRPENRLFFVRCSNAKTPHRRAVLNARRTGALALKNDTGNNKTMCGSCDRIHRVRIDGLCGTEVLCFLLFGAVIRSMVPEEIGAKVVVFFFRSNVVAAVLVMTCRHIAHRALCR